VTLTKLFHINVIIYSDLEQYSVFVLLVPVRPEMVVSRQVSILLAFILHFRQEISELRLPIAAKFCTVIRSVLDFINTVQNFNCPPPKKVKDQKHAKFGVILDDFKI